MSAPGIRRSIEIEFLAKLQVIVDLTVEGDHIPAGGREHGLMPSRGQINDREPRVAERNAGGSIDPGPVVVGTAMIETRSQPADEFLGCGYVQSLRTQNSD
jgi:hypothetical protein